MRKETVPVRGVLVRRVPVRVRDVSAGGCLLESAAPLPEGTIGLLEIEVDGERHAETLRISRSTRQPGGVWPWRAGAQFLTLGAPEQTSVRNMVARLEILEELGLPPVTDATLRLQP